jgi:hypothetical protein
MTGTGSHTDHQSQLDWWCRQIEGVRAPACEYVRKHWAKPCHRVTGSRTGSGDHDARPAAAGIDPLELPVVPDDPVRIGERDQLQAMDLLLGVQVDHREGVAGIGIWPVIRDDGQPGS